MKKSKKKFLRKEFVVVTDLVQELTERVEMMESRILNCLISNALREGTSPSSPLASPPGTALKSVNDGQPQNISDDGKSKPQ